MQIPSLFAELSYRHWRRHRIMHLRFYSEDSFVVELWLDDQGPKNSLSHPVLLILIRLCPEIYILFGRKWEREREDSRIDWFKASFNFILVGIGWFDFLIFYNVQMDAFEWCITLNWFVRRIRWRILIFRWYLFYQQTCNCVKYRELY